MREEEGISDGCMPPIGRREGDTLLLPNNKGEVQVDEDAEGASLRDTL